MMYRCVAWRGVAWRMYSLLACGRTHVFALSRERNTLSQLLPFFLLLLLLLLPPQFLLVLQTPPPLPDADAAAATA